MTVMPILASDNPLNHVVQHPLPGMQVTVESLPVTDTLTLLSNQIVMQILAALLLILLVPWAVRRARGHDEINRLVPAGPGNFFEGICQFLRTNVAQPALGEYTDRFVPYVWTVFFFILFSNLLGLLPFDALLRVFGVELHIGGTATGNIWVTATLAVCTLVMIVVNGLRLGGTAYLAHFCPGPLWLAWLLVPVEVLGLIAKIFALAVRLFANMLAGHVLLAVLIGFVATSFAALGAVGGFAVSLVVVLGSVAINLLEVFVAFLQAFIFTFLTALFIGQAVLVHHGHDEEHEHDAHEHKPAAAAEHA